MKTLGYGIKQGFKNIVQNKIFSLVAIGTIAICLFLLGDRKSTRLNSSHNNQSRMPSSA